MSDVPILQKRNNITPTIGRNNQQSGSGEEVAEKIKQSANFFSQSVKSAGGFLQQSASGVLGDTSWITQPFSNLKKSFSPLADYFKKKRKVAPKRNQILKVNPETVYLADVLTKKDKEGEEGEGLLSSLLGGMGAGGLMGIGSKLLPGLAKAAPFLALAAGVIWGVMDAVAAVAKAEEWGTSKAAAGIGGFLGGTESGLKNAFKNAGKFALMGVGIGFMVGSLPGAIAGGLIGAAIGGILGFIGGEKIAQAMQKIGEFFKNMWQKIVGFFKNLIEGIKKIFSGELEGFFGRIVNFLTFPIRFVIDQFKGLIERFKSIWGDEDKTFLQKVWGTIKEILLFVPRTLFNWGKVIFEKAKGVFEVVKNIVLAPFKFIIEKVKGLVEGFKNLWGDEDKTFLQKIWGSFVKIITFIPKLIWDGASRIISGIGGFFAKIFDGKALKGILKKIFTKGSSFIWDIVTGAWEWLKGLFGRLWSGIKSFAVSVGKFVHEWIIQPIGRFITNLWEGAKTVATNVWDFIKEWIITPIGNFIGNLWEGAKGIALNIWDFLKQWIIDPVGDFFRNIWEKGKAFVEKVVDKLNEWIIQPIVGLFQGIVDVFKNMGYRVQALNVANVEFQKRRRAAIDITEQFAEKGQLEELNKILLEKGLTQREGLRQITMERILASEEAGEAFRQALLEGSIRSAQQIDDAIITNKGQIIQTNPQDTIIATKTEPYVQEGPRPLQDAMEREYVQMRMAMTQEDINEQKNLLERIAQSIEAGNRTGAGSNIIQQNYMSRFNPINFMNNLRVDVL
jgi:hypothetical protein